MNLGVVILSNAHTPELVDVTSRILDSLTAAIRPFPDTLVLEQSNRIWGWPGVRTIRMDAEFNFNRFANFGMANVAGDHVLIANNDLVFHPGSLERLYACAVETGLAVVCPVCPHNERQAHLRKPEVGTEIGVHFAGWCFLIRRDAWETIGYFDEDFPFWYADNAVVEQLEQAGLEIAVLPSAKVEHYASQTLATLPRRQRQELTRQQRSRFEAKYR